MAEQRLRQRRRRGVGPLWVVGLLVTLSRPCSNPSPWCKPNVAVPPPASPLRRRAEVQTFRQVLSATFHAHTLTALTLPPNEIQIAPDHSRVTFLEVESRQNPLTQSHETWAYRTTFRLTQTPSNNGTVTVRISGVARAGPLVTLTTPGQVQVGALTRLVVNGHRRPVSPGQRRAGRWGHGDRTDPARHRHELSRRVCGRCGVVVCGGAPA